MATYVALLRGINVGGHNRVSMADLRRIAASLGHGDVSTYIQSGNVLFDSDGSDPAAIAAGLEQAIAAELGLDIAVVVVSAEELAQIARANPYPDEPNPKYVHVIFRRDEAGPEVVAALTAAQQVAAAKGGRDTVTAIGRAVYLHTPDGYGTSELGKALLKIREASGTARNWATTTKLLSLCEGFK